MVKYKPKVGDHVRPVRHVGEALEYCRRWRVPDSFVITRIDTRYNHFVMWDQKPYCPGLKVEWVKLGDGPW